MARSPKRAPKPKAPEKAPTRRVTEPVTSISQLDPEGTRNVITLAEQIAPFYADVGGVENAIRRAQKALAQDADPEYRQYFPAYDIAGYTNPQTLIPVDRLDKAMAGEFLPDGYSSQVLRDGEVVDHIADGDELLISRHLDPTLRLMQTPNDFRRPRSEVPESVMHEGTHGAILGSLLNDTMFEDSAAKRGYFFQQPVTGTDVAGNPILVKAPVPGQVVVAAARPDGDFDPKVVDIRDFQYTTTPIELDPRLAQIRRLSAQITGKDVKTPVQAKKLLERVYSDPAFAQGTGLSEAEADYLGMLPSRWQNFMARRMIEVPALAAAYGLSQPEAEAAPPASDLRTIRDMARSLSPETSEQPVLEGIPDAQLQRQFQRSSPVQTRYEAVFKDVANRRFVPWVKSLPEYPGEEAVAQAVDALMGKPASEDGQGLAENFLDHMESISYGGKNAPDASISQSDYAQWQKEDTDPRSRLTAGGAEMFENQRDYDLMRAFHTGRHNPGYDSQMANVAASVGHVLDFTQDSKDIWRMRKQGGPEGKMGEALYWWDRSNPIQDAIQGKPARFKDGIQGSRFPGLSPLTAQGLNQTVSNSDNIVGSVFSAGELAARGLLETAVTEPQNLPQAYRNFQDQLLVNNYSGRPTPIVPDRDPELGKEAALANEKARQFQHKAASARTPRVLKSLGMEPTYMSTAGEIVSHLPGDWVMDPSTALWGGMAGVKAAIKAPTMVGKALGPARGALKYLAHELPSEAPFEVAVGGAMAYSQLAPDANIPSLFAPEQYNDNVRLDGEPLKANDPRYEEAWQAGQDEQQKRLRRVQEAATRYRDRRPK